MSSNTRSTINYVRRSDSVTVIYGTLADFSQQFEIAMRLARRGDRPEVRIQVEDPTHQQAIVKDDVDGLAFGHLVRKGLNGEKWCYSVQDGGSCATVIIWLND